jgi:hypothetical protein
VALFSLMREFPSPKMTISYERDLFGSSAGFPFDACSIVVVGGRITKKVSILSCMGPKSSTTGIIFSKFKARYQWRNV